MAKIRAFRPHQPAGADGDGLEALAAAAAVNALLGRYRPAIYDRAIGLKLAARGWTEYEAALRTEMNRFVPPVVQPTF